MRSVKLVFFGILGVAAISVIFAFAMGRAWASSDPDVDNLVDGGNMFAIDLYAKLSTRIPDNLFFSSYSIHTALGMTYLGASGETAQEMARALHFDLNLDLLGPAFEKLTKALNTPSMLQAYVTHKGKQIRKRVPSYRLNVANSLWAMKDYHFTNQYIAAVQRYFQAELRELDFVTKPEFCRKIINQWIEAKTEEKIKNIIPPNAIDQRTRLVLANAIYFNSDWEDKFKKSNTADKPFFLADGRTVICSQMFQKNRFKYYQGDTFKALSLPYRSRELDMLIFLPNEPSGLPAFEERFTIANIKKWLPLFKHYEVEVTLPQFSFESGFRLREILRTMGIILAFKWPGADFSGMTNTKKLYISAVIHKAFIKLDEEGTEATGATAVVVPTGNAISKEEPKVFKADHAFIFLIRHQTSGAILFIGRLSCPKS